MFCFPEVGNNDFGLTPPVIFALLSMDQEFHDLLEANAEAARHFTKRHPDARPSGRVAILTCMDARIDPLRIFGLEEGDAPILRNAGARVTDDVERDIIVARHVLNVTRLMIVAHTDCKMGVESADVIHDAIAAAGGPDTRAIEFAVIPDQRAALAADVARIRSSEYLAGMSVGAFIYDVSTGRVARVC